MNAPVKGVEELETLRATILLNFHELLGWTLDGKSVTVRLGGSYQGNVSKKQI